MDTQLNKGDTAIAGLRAAIQQAKHMVSLYLSQVPASHYAEASDLVFRCGMQQVVATLVTDAKRASPVDDPTMLGADVSVELGDRVYQVSLEVEQVA